jgi:hypothetical protein
LKSRNTITRAIQRLTEAKKKPTLGSGAWGKLKQNVEGSSKLSAELAEMAHNSFMLYRNALTNSVDNHKLVQLIRFCGCRTDEADAQAQMERVGVFADTGVGHKEFLSIFENLVTEGRDVLDPAVTSSMYGTSARRRWISSDGDAVPNGDITGELVPPHRRLSRLLVLHKTLELFFFASICISAVVAGLETSPYFVGVTRLT